MWGDSLNKNKSASQHLQKDLYTTQYEKQALTFHFSAIFTRWRVERDCFWGPTKTRAHVLVGGGQTILRGRYKAMGEERSEGRDTKKRCSNG